MKHPQRWMLGSAAAALMLMGAACGSDNTKDAKSVSTPPASSGASVSGTTTNTAPSPTSATSTAAASAATSVSKAADLRTALTGLLSEHEALASKATGAAIDGRTDEYKATADSLDANSVDLSKAIGSVFGPQAEASFLPLWRQHIGFFVDYTQGAAAGDQAKKDKAKTDLAGYVQNSSTFFNTAIPGLSKDALVNVLSAHVAGLTTVIDAQAAKDPAKAYTEERKAFAHMGMIADALAGGIAKQSPDKFPGNEGSKASTLRANLDLLMREHVFLASQATGAALGGRAAEFKAAADVLDTNSVDISKAIGSAYGADAEASFLPLWRQHVGFFVDYTNGVAMNDKAKQDKAVADLQGYVQNSAAFFNKANGLPTATVADLLTKHILGLKGVVDDQGAKDWVKTSADLRMGVAHMQMLTDPLAEATVKKFPEKFTS